VALLVFGVRERSERARAANAGKRVSWRDAQRLDQRFYIITAIASVLTLARFSEAFLVLRAQNVGMGNTGAPWVMVAMSLVYAVVAYPAGRVADRGHATALLSAGLAALVVSDVVLALAHGATGALAGAALWGLHMALTQGLLAALVAATAPHDLRGTAFGVFNLASGVALLVASALAGYLWQTIGPAATFFAGAGFTVIAGLGLSWYAPRVPRLDGAS
jgi:MFS family permease